ncbi:hypothetical protein BHM03_00056879 [Ensete ventricosum]|nr:hypothetical protein BHM03_00056879 [Ensete ventricosum]
MDGHDAQEPTSTAEVPIVRLITEPLLASHPLPTPSTVASHRSRFRVFAASRRRMALSSSSFALRRLLRVSSSASLPQWTWSPRSVYRQNSSSSTSSPSPSIFPFDDDDAASNLPPLTTPKLFVSGELSGLCMFQILLFPWKCSDTPSNICRVERIQFFI